MKFTRGALLLLSGLSSFAMAQEVSHAASIFVQDPAIFHRRQAELQALQGNLEAPNENLEALLAEADKVAKMNDKCTVVSINDVMDESCWTFYKVDLPAFEQHYTEVTSEIRLGYMETVRELQDRKLQIDACANSLTSFVFSKEENILLEGGVSLEPLSSGFEANYDFTIQYNPEQRNHILEIAKVWGETCKDMVTRQDGASFAPFFVEQLDRLNKELHSMGSQAVIKLDSAATPTIYVDIAKPVRGAYYLNNVKIFHSRISSSTSENSNLRIAFTKDGVVTGGEKIVKKPNGEPMQYKGHIQFAENTSKVVGRWFLEGAGNTEGVDFGPDYDEDSLAVAKAEEAQREQAAAQNIAEEKAAEESSRKGLHFSFWAGISGSRIDFKDKSVCGFLGYSSMSACANEKDSNGNYAKYNYTFYLPDIDAAARIKYNFGPDADLFVTAGAGGMFGLAFGPKKNFPGQYKRGYVGLLGQFEVGYKTFGIRETMIYHIVLDHDVAWHQFRTGGFYGFNLSKAILNLELGYNHIITENVDTAGSGFYVSVSTTF